MMHGLHASDFAVILWAPGPWELAIIAFIALLLFGSRLPGVARSLGKGITEFKKGLREPSDADGDESSKPPATRKPDGE